MQAEEVVVNTYQQIKIALTDRLIHQGYQPVHEQHHDPVFDSRLIIWSNNAEALRLTWDGKEQWFALELTQELPLTALSSWSPLIIAPFEAGNRTPAKQEQVMQQIIASLS